jgi:chemotaxis family two-component system response regulator Rcp1
MKTTAVLLVDDNLADSELTAGLLEDGPYSIRTHVVIDGIEAIGFLRRTGKYANELLPDFVILDLNLPKKNGLAVLAEVKADPLLRKIPITIFSTSEAEQDIASTYELGGNCYVRKPGNLSDYVHAVGSIRTFWFGLACLPGGRNQ